jgi:RNA polymerase sigma-70 factor (ECF subfamily)
MAAVAGASRFDPTRGSVRAFLLGIARRELLALRRKQARESRALLREGAHQPVQSSPSGPLVRRQELRLLLNALRELPLELQIVLELHYWEDLTVAEVAQVVEIPAGTVKSRLARARQQLRERIAAADAPAEIVRSTVDGLERWAGALRDQLTRT